MLIIQMLTGDADHAVQVPVTFIYGDTDWMDPKGGARVCKEIRQERGQLTPADLLVTSIPQAGHYPFLDQPELFMKALLEQTKPYRHASLRCCRQTACLSGLDRPTVHGCFVVTFFLIFSSAKPATRWLPAVQYVFCSS